MFFGVFCLVSFWSEFSCIPFVFLPFARFLNDAQLIKENVDQNSIFQMILYSVFASDFLIFIALYSISLDFHRIHWNNVNGNHTRFLFYSLLLFGFEEK